jgi:hypothetical protein
MSDTAEKSRTDEVPLIADTPASPKYSNPVGGEAEDESAMKRSSVRGTKFWARDSKVRSTMNHLGSSCFDS